MAYSAPTEHLGVSLPIAGTQQQFEVQNYRNAWETADARVGVVKQRVSNLETATNRPEYVAQADNFYQGPTFKFLGQVGGTPDNQNLPYAEILDPLAWHDPAVNTERITPNIKGVYRVDLQVRFSSSASLAGIRQAVIQLNGTTIEEDVDQAFQLGAPTTLRVMALRQMNGVNDYFAAGIVSGSPALHDIHAIISVKLIQPN